MKWKEIIQQLDVPGWERCWTRALAWILVFALLVPSRGLVFAYEEAPPEDGRCVHHPEHTAECGYIESSEGSPCAHTHDEECGYSESAEGAPCTHEHSGDCGFTEAVEEIPCNMNCAETDGAGAILHDPACAYAPPAEGTPCGHEHDEACGYSEPAEGAPCTHEHNGDCGFAEAVEGASCGYVCELCVTGWQWDDEKELLTWSEDAKLWGLGVPAASAENPVTQETLLALLPAAVTADTAAGPQTVELVWDLSALPEEGAYEGSYTLTAQLGGEYALTEAAPVPEVLLELGGGETYVSKYVSNWEFIPRDGTTIIQADGAFLIDVQLADLERREALVQILNETLPAQIRGQGYTAGGELVAAGFIPEEAGSYPFGRVNIKWNVERVLPADPPYAEKYTFAATPVVNNSGHRIIINSNVPNAPNSDGDPNLLSITVVLHPLNLSSHIAAPAAPENVKVNLFDYWVATPDPATSSTGDILSAGDVHYHEDGGEGALGTTPTGYSNQEDWNKGINQGHLLLFGDGLIHAGLWNKGAGQNCRYGKEYAGMEGIVRTVLDANGYPELNLENADKILTGEKNAPEYNSKYNTDKYKLIKDYALTGDHKNDLHSNGSGYTYDSSDIQNLSKTVIQTWAKDIEKDAESLQYLFDPTVPNPYKTSYTDVSGLFQLDKDGYYYYNMRENFAEFVEEPGNNHFILYNAPATVRTDNEQSIGNFFPFNKGSEVFNGTDANGNLTSSVYCARNAMNHHLGMTVEVDFRQPLNGRINTGSNAQPMTFQFSGDDDVWVFIDDVLVLDMGGVHSEVYGIIDFESGSVLVGRGFNAKGIPTYDPENPQNTEDLVTETNLMALYEAAGRTDSTKWNGSTFASNTSHTLKMFYLERGNYDSSIALRFNLQPLLYQQIKKVDQNGGDVPGVQFALYPAEKSSKGDAGAIECLYTDNDVMGGEPFYVKQAKTGDGKALVTLETGSDGSAQFLQKDGTYFNFADRGPQYYILREINAPAGYRKQPVDIVLYYDPHTAMLSAANRWSTGAYACSVAHVTSFIPKNADGTPTAEERGLVVAVPLLKKSSENWFALYGSNLSGFQSVPAGKEEEDAILLAALYQAKANAADWHLVWDEGNSRLKGTLSDLPGLSNRYTLVNPDGDMKMAYGLISAEALNSLGVSGSDADERYENLRKYLGSHTPEEACAAIGSGFRRLDTDTFNRDFRSLIYIPNERRELRVLKINQDGAPLEGARFGLYDAPACTGEPAASGYTDANGMLVFSPTGKDDTAGQAQMTWANSTPKDKPQYYLKEITPPAGYDANPTVIPVIVGIYSIYADAGSEADGVSVMAGVGRLTQAMRQYAMGGDVDITLQDITAFMQIQDSGKFRLDNWRDSKLEATDIPRSMDLHYGRNNDNFSLVDYGLHDEDGGKIYQPFFVTDTGFVRTKIQQNEKRMDPSTNANKDSLGSTDLTNLFSLLNIVVVTDKTNPPQEKTVQLTISKKVEGTDLADTDYTRTYHFSVSLTDAGGKPLSGNFKYNFYGKDKWGYISNGGELLLHHDESVTILGLPEGTQFTVTETDALSDGWHVTPDRTISGTAGEENAEFTNTTKPKDPETPSKDPETPPKDPETPPKDPETPPKDPETPPKDPETPPKDPETPEDPHSDPPEEHLTELPDPNDPESPDKITIWDDDIPTTYVKWWDPEAEEWVYIPENEIPLMNMEPDPEPTVPATGDGILFWLLASGASLTGLTVVRNLRRKEDEEE